MTVLILWCWLAASAVVLLLWIGLSLLMPWLQRRSESRAMRQEVAALLRRERNKESA